MRKLKLTLLLLCLSVIFFSCKSGGSGSGPQDVMTASIGTTSFSSKGNNVYAQTAANSADNSKTELTITGQSGNTVLTVAVFDYRDATGTFSFSEGDALGAYNSGNSSTGDDVITSGSLVITTVNASSIQGTFSGTTQGGVAITNGSFTVYK